MSTTMDQVVKKAKDSFGPIFDKSLHDLVRGIRNHKDNEVRYLISFFIHDTHFHMKFYRPNILMKLLMKLNKNLNKRIWQ